MSDGRHWNAIGPSDNGRVREAGSCGASLCCQDTGIDWRYVALGKPMRNAFVTRFKGGFRGGLVNETLY